MIDDKGQLETDPPNDTAAEGLAGNRIAKILRRQIGSTKAVVRVKVDSKGRLVTDPPNDPTAKDIAGNRIARVPKIAFGAESRPVVAVRGQNVMLFPSQLSASKHTTIDRKVIGKAQKVGGRVIRGTWFGNLEGIPNRGKIHPHDHGAQKQTVAIQANGFPFPVPKRRKP